MAPLINFPHLRTVFEVYYHLLLAPFWLRSLKFPAQHEARRGVIAPPNMVEGNFPSMNWAEYRQNCYAESGCKHLKSVSSNSSLLQSHCGEMFERRMTGTGRFQRWKLLVRDSCTSLICISHNFESIL